MTTEHTKTEPARKPARFGTVLGMAPGGVPVYSSDYDTADRRRLRTRHSFQSYVDGVYMGYKWQCVELARRWLYVTKGLIFDDVPMAYDIFRLRSVRSVADGTTHPLKSFRNGSRRRPEPGALLIWNEGGEFDVTGHVAVITEVFDDCVRCAEQNVENLVWPEGQDYSRELKAHVAADGGYRVECSYGDAAILGWVMPSDDGTDAEEFADPDPRLFDLRLRELPRTGRGNQLWLDPSKPDEVAYMAMMRGSRLVSDDADRRKFFCISATAQKELRRATNELHAMFLRATGQVLDDDELLRRFDLPSVLWPRIRASWNNRRNQMITGRFDFSVSARGIKAYEYNADSASCHMECGKVQTKWAAHFGCDVGTCAGTPLFDSLVAAWKKSGVGGTLHIMQDHNLEETYHALYMKSAMEQAGIRCKVVKGMLGLDWDDAGCVVDADGERIDWVWKTWAWETALDQIRAECAEDDENLHLHKSIDRRTMRPRLVDVLFRKEVMVFEPLWTLVTSNKAMLPVLSMMYPKNRFLLNTAYELGDEMVRDGYVAKPIVGRCGFNIQIFEPGNDLVSETGGQFDNRDLVYQELFPLAEIDGRNVQVSTFSVAGSYAGACIRADASPIIMNDSDILPLRVVDDEALLAGD